MANISCISTDRRHFGCSVPGLVVSGPAIRMKRRRKLSKEELRDHYIDLMIAAILREDWVGRHRQSNLFCFSNPCGILCYLMCIRLVFSNMRQSAACSSSQLCLVLYSCCRSNVIATLAFCISSGMVFFFVWMVHGRSRSGETSDPEPMMARVCCSSPARVMSFKLFLFQMIPNTHAVGCVVGNFSLA